MTGIWGLEPATMLLRWLQTHLSSSKPLVSSEKPPTSISLKMVWAIAAATSRVRTLARSAAQERLSCRRPFHSRNVRRRAEPPLEPARSTVKFCRKHLPSLTTATRQCGRITGATLTSSTSGGACAWSASSIRSTTTRPRGASPLRVLDSSTAPLSSFKIPTK